MKTMDLMVFDFDGTLVSSGEDIATSVNLTLRDLGLEGLEREKVIGFVGDGVKKLIERALGEEHRDLFDRALTKFKDFYAKHLLDTTGLYPGVGEILQYFSDKRKVILTNKNYAFTITIARALGLEAHFDDIIAGDSTPYFKPDLRLIQPLMARFKAEAHRTAVIGDSIQDILLARNAGAVSCAFLNGLVQRDTLLGLKPDYTFEIITEMKSYFK
jgi:phosphoglycolate phosphatase